MAYSPTRPSCEQILPNGAPCGDPAHQLGKDSNGNKTWRTFGGKWTCMYHHEQNYPMQHPNRLYTQHKKSYCENRDGRLGKKCTTTITHPKELTVDHIDENHNNDDPANLQTLCACCHNLKTHQDYVNRGNNGERVLAGTPLENRRPDLFGYVSWIHL